VLIVDDILLSPVHGILWIFQKIHDAAQQELAGEAENITAQLSELYMMLETKSITEQEFDEREKILLDWLDKVQEREGDGDDESENIDDAEATEEEEEGT
jgi:hypothetical protein